MDVHQNAKTTPHGRRLMIERLAEGWTVARVAAAAGVTAKTVGKWRGRHAQEGEAGLADRSSRPHASPSRLPDAVVAEILALRRQRLSGPAIARRLGRPISTVGLVLRRHRLARLHLLDPKPEIVRYQRDRPGKLIHLDIKKLGRIGGVGHRITGDRRGQKKEIGWEFLHVCVDDASRLAYTEILPDERKESAVAFLERAIAWFASLGVTVERVMTDNGSAYRSHAFRAACQAARVKHKRTKPYTPRTNGKAELFIQTSLREWAYRQAFPTSAERTAAMRPWLHGYNRHRPHSALGGKPPFTRLPKDILLGNDRSVEASAGGRDARAWRIGLDCERKKEKGVSDCLGLSSWVGCPPWGSVPEHGIEDDQELAHGGSQRELLGFPTGEQALIEGADHRVVARGDQRRHVERAAHGGAAAPDRPAPAHDAAVAGERCHAGEAGGGLAVDAAELGHQRQQAHRGQPADPGGRDQEVGALPLRGTGRIPPVRTVSR